MAGFSDPARPGGAFLHRSTVNSQPFRESVRRKQKTTFGALSYPPNPSARFDNRLPGDPSGTHRAVGKTSNGRPLEYREKETKEERNYHEKIIGSMVGRQNCAARGSQEVVLRLRQSRSAVLKRHARRF
jgi:hypothetical protein